MTDHPRRSDRLLALVAANGNSASSARGEDDEEDKRCTVGRFELVDAVKVRRVVRRGDRLIFQNVSDGPNPKKKVAPRLLPPDVHIRSLSYEEAKGYGIIQHVFRTLIASLGDHDNIMNNGLSFKITSLDSISSSKFDFVLPHSHMLMPHWKALCEALMSYTGDVCFVGLVATQLDRSVLKLLSPALVARNVTSLYFLGNDLGRRELSMISDLIGQLATLESLAFSHNHLGDQDNDVVEGLSTAIRSHRSLQRLTLSSCGIGNNKVMLSCIRNKSLRSIDLGSNGIRSEGAYIIAKFIAKNKNRKLSRVCLEGNKFNNKDAILFASALRVNNSLQNLDLQRNEIYDEGEKILVKALYDDSTLNALADSNHTCRVNLDEDNYTLYDMNNSLYHNYSGRKSKLCTKIFGQQAGTSNVLYFEELPVKLIPNALGLIQHNPVQETKYFDKFDQYFDKRTRSLTFTLLRAMPWIFTADLQQLNIVVTRKRKHDQLTHLRALCES